MVNRFLIKINDNHSNYELVQEAFSVNNQIKLFGHKCFKIRWIKVGFDDLYLDIIISCGNYEQFEYVLNSVGQLLDVYELTEDALSLLNCYFFYAEDHKYRIQANRCKDYFTKEINKNRLYNIYLLNDNDTKGSYVYCLRDDQNIDGHEIPNVGYMFSIISISGKKHTVLVNSYTLSNNTLRPLNNSIFTGKELPWKR